MIDKVKEYIKKDLGYKKLLKVIYDNPYSEKKTIIKQVSMDEEKAEQFLSDLENDLIILELTTQANSDIESRVPKKIYLINPDIEQDMEGLV